jgi:hypothetical protein
MKTPFLVLLLLLAAAVAACDEESQPPQSTATTLPTATPPPPVRFDVSGPAPADTLVPGGVSIFATYVFDLQLRMLYTVELTEIERNSAEHPVAFRGWTEEGALLFSGDVGTWTVTLDGAVKSADIDPPSEPTPSEASADGAWRTMRSGEGLVIMDESGAARYRLISWNVGLGWAPGGHLAAFNTGACRNGEIHVLDPDAGTLEELTASDDYVLDWLWHPDGRQIAANVVGLGLGLYTVARDGADAIVPFSGGELTPIDWSTDGRYLAFRYRGGRDFGCGEGAATEPPYAPPRLERICDGGLC